MSIRGIIRLRTVGFLKSNCFFEKEKIVAKPVVEEKVKKTSNVLKTLPDLDTLEQSDATRFDSISAAPENEEMAKEKASMLTLAVLVIFTLCSCCICFYCWLKHRRTCFKKRDPDRRGSH